MSYLAPPKTFELQLHWFQTASEAALPVQLAAEFTTLNSSNEFIVLGTIKNRVRFTATVFNSTIGAPVQYYDAYSVQVGDWIANNASGFAWRITELYTVQDNRFQQSDSLHFFAKMIDYASYNRGLDKRGRGIGCPNNVDSDAVLFTTDNYGMPILSGLDTDAIDPNFATVLQSRFNALNIKRRFLSIKQTGAAELFHSGDPIYIDPETGLYKKSQGLNDTNIVQYTIGVVTSVGIPTNDYFTFSPFGEYRSASEVGLTGPIGTIFYIDPTGANQYVTTRPTKFPFPVYQIIDSEANVILVKGDIFGIQTYAEDSTIRVTDLSVGTISALEKGGQIKFADSFYTSSAQISTLNTDGIFFRSQNTTSTVTMLYADNKNTLYWDGKPLIPAPPTPYAMPSTIQVSSIVTAHISGFDSTTAITIGNPINVPVVNASSIQTSSVQANGLYLSNSNVTGLLTTDPSLTLLWNGLPVGSGGGGGTSALSSYNNLATSSFSVSSIGSLYSSDIIYFKNPFAASEASISTLKTGGLLISGSNSQATGLLNADTNLNLYWNGKPIGQGQGSSATSSFTNLATSSFAVSSIKAATSSGTIFFENAFQAPTAIMSSLVTKDLRIEDPNNIGASLKTDSNLQLLWNGKPIAQGSALSTFDTLYTNSLAVSSIKAIVGADTIFFDSNVSISSAKVSSIDAVSLRLESNTVSAYLQTNDNLQLLWNGTPIGTGGASSQTISTFDIITASTVATNGINLTSGSASAFLQTNANLELLWNGKPVGQASSTFSTLTALDLTVSSITGTAGSIIFNGKLVASDATINNLNTNGINFQNSSITNSSLGRLYADNAKDLYWNGEKVIKPPVSSFNTLTTSSFKVSTIAGFGPSDAIYFANPIKTSTIYALNIGIQGQGTSSTANLYALSDLSLMWNGKPVINTTGVLEISSIKAGALQSQNPGEPLVFKSPIQAKKANVKALASESISLNYKPTESQLLGASGTPAGGSLNTDANNNILWNGKQLISNTVSTFFVSSIGGFSSSDAINFTGPIKATVANISTLTASGLELTGQTNDTKATLYADTQLKLFWNNKPLVDNKFPDIYVGAIHALESTQTIELKSNLIGLNATFSSLQTSELKLSSGDKSSILHTDAQLNLLWNGENITGYKSTILTSTLIASSANIGSLSTNSINFPNGTLQTDAASQLLFNGVPIGKTTTFDEIKVSSITGTGEIIDFTTKIAASEAAIKNLNTQTITISDETTGSSAELKTDGGLNLLWNGKQINSNTNTPGLSSTLTVSTIAAFVPSEPIVFLSPISVPNITTSSSVIASGFGLRYNNTSTFLYTNEKKELLWDGKPLINNTPGSLTDKLTLSTLSVSSIGSLNPNAPLYFTNAIVASNLATSSISFNGKTLYTSTNELLWDGAVIITSKTSTFTASTLSLNTLYVSTISSLSGILTINADLMATKIATESVLLGLAPNAALLTTNESQELLWNGKPLNQSNSVISSFTTLFASTASISTLSTNTIILAGRQSTTSGELYADASLNLYWNGHQVIKTAIPGSETIKISSILVSTIGSLLSSDTIYITSKVHVSDITVSTLMTGNVVFQSAEGNKSILYTKGDSIYFNNTPLISTSLTISSIRVSTLSAQGDSINLTSKLIGTTATISSINTNSLILDYLDKSGVLTTDSTLGLFWNGTPLIQGSTKAPDTLQISSILVSSIGSLNSSDQIIFRNAIRASDAIITLLKTDTISFGPNYSTGQGLLHTDSSFNLVWNGVPLMQNTSTISIGDLETSNIKAPTPGATIQISNPIKAPSVEANGFTISQAMNERLGLAQTTPNTLQVNGANQITWNGMPLITDTNSTLFVSSIVGLGKSIDFANLIKAPSAEIAKVTTALLELAAASTIGKLTMDGNMTLLWNGTPVISKSSTVTQNNSTLFASTINTDGLNLIGRDSEKSSLLYADSNLNLYWNGAPLGNTAPGTKFSSIEVSTISALNPQDTLYFTNSIDAPTANLSVITTTLININKGSLTTNANNELTWNGASLMPSSMSMGSSFNTLLINNIGAISTGGAINFLSPFTGSTGSLSTLAVNGITLIGENTATQGLLYADKNLSLFWNGKPIERSVNNLNISSLVVSSISAQIGSSTIDFTDPIKTSALVLASKSKQATLYTDDSLNLFWNGVNILKTASSSSHSTFYASSIITDGLFLLGANTNVSSLLYADANMNLFWNNMPLNSNTSTSKFSSLQVSSINALTPGGSITFADTLSSENANIKKLRTTGVIFDSADSTATGLLYIDNDKNLIWNGTSLTGQGQSTTTAFPVINVSTIAALKTGDTIFFSDKFLVSDASISTLNTTGIRINSNNSLNSALLQADSSLTLLWNGKPLINTVSPSSIQISSLVVSYISADNPSADIAFENPIKAPTLKLTPDANLSANEGGANEGGANEGSTSKKGSLYTDAAYNLYWGGVMLNQTAASLSSFSTIKVSTIGSLEQGGTIFFTDGINILDAHISTLKTPGVVLESKGNKTAILQTDDNLNLLWNGKALGQSATSSISSFVSLNVSTLYAYTKGEPIVFGDRFVAQAGSISTLMITKMLINSQTGTTGSLYADENLNLIWEGKILNASTQQQQTQSTFENINVSSISAINSGDTILIKDNFQAQTGSISTIKTSGINIENAEAKTALLTTDKNLDLVWNGTPLRKIAPQLSTFEVSSLTISSVAGFLGGPIEFTAPIKTENIILKPTQLQEGLYVDAATNLYWNSTQITGVSTTSINNSSLFVSSITADGIILIGKDTTKQSLLYADENLNLFWNGTSLNQPFSLSTIFSTIMVSSISAISSGEKIYFTDNISVPEIDANKINISKIALNSESGSKQGILYADKDLNLIWNGSSLTAQAAIASSVIISSFSTLNVGSIGPYTTGQNIYFTAPIAASDANISSINTDGITIRGQNATGSALLYADTNLNLFWNGKPIIAAGTSTSQNSSLAVSSLTVSSISGFNPQDTIVFNNAIETQALQLQTGTGTSGKLYTDSTLNLFWNGVQLNTQASTISTSASVFFSTVITDGLFLVGTDTSKQTKLYADKDQNLYWGTSQLVNAPEITHSSLKVSSISGISTGEKVTFLDSIVAPDIKVSKILLGQNTVGSLYTDANLNLLWNGTILGGGQSSMSTSMVSTFSTISIGSINALEPNGLIVFNSAFKAQDATISSIRADGISLVGKNTNVASLLYADEKQNLFWNGIQITKSTALAELSTFAVSSLIVSTIAAFGPNDVIEFLNPLKTKQVLLSAGTGKQGALYTDDNLNLLWNGSTLSGLNNSSIFVSSIITTGLFLVSKDTSKSSLLYANKENNLFWDNRQLQVGDEYSTLRVSSLFALDANLSTTKTDKILIGAGNNSYGSLYTDASLNLMWNGMPISANSTAMLSSFKTLNIGLIGPYAVNDNIYFGAPIVASSATISTINTGGISITAQNANTSSLLYADEMLNLYWNGKSLTANTAASETLNISSIVVSTISGYNPQDSIVFTNAVETTGLNLQVPPGMLGLDQTPTAQAGKLYTDATLNLFWNGVPLIKSTITFYSTLTISSLLTDGIFITGNTSKDKTQLYASKDQTLYWGSTQIINNAKATHSTLGISTIAALNAADTIYFANPIYVSEANTSTIKTKLVTIETEDGVAKGRLYADKNLNLMWNGSSLMAKVISTFSTINVGVIGPLPGSNAVYFSSQIVTVAANISTLNTTGILIRGQNSAESSLLYADEKLNLFWQGKPIIPDGNQSTISVSSLIVSSISAYVPGMTIVFNNQLQTDGIKLVASDKSYSGTIYADGNKNIFWNGTQLNTSVDRSTLYISSLITDGLVLLEKNTGISSQVYTEKGQLFWSSLQIINNPQVTHSSISVSTISALNKDDTLYFTNAFSAENATISSLNIAALNIQANGGQNKGSLYADADLNLIWNGKAISQGSSMTQSSFTHINVSSIGALIPGSLISFTDKITASDGAISSLQTDGIVFRGNTSNISTTLYADANLNLIWNGVPLNNGIPSIFSTLKASTFQTGTIGSVNSTQKIYFTNRFYASDAEISTLFTSGIGLGLGILRTDANSTLIWNNEPIIKSSMNISTIYTNIISSIIPNQPIIFNSDFQAPKAKVSSLNANTIILSNPDSTSGSLYTNSKLELLWNGGVISQISSFSTFKILSLNVSSIGSSDTIYFNAKFAASDAYIRNLATESLGVINKETGLSSQLYADKNLVLQWNGKPLISEVSSFSTIFVSTIGAFAGSSITFTSRFYASDATISTLRTSGLLISSRDSNTSTLLYADKELNLLWNNNKVLIQSTFINVSSLLVSTIGGLTDNIQFITPVTISSANISSLGVGLIKLGSQGLILSTDKSKELFWDGKPLLKSSFIALQASSFAVSTISALIASDSIYFKSNISSATANISSITASEILFASSSTKLSLTINSTGEITWTGVPLIKRDPTVTISTLRTNNIRPEVDSGTIRFDGPIETKNIMTNGLSLSAGLAMSRTTFGINNRQNQLYVDANNILFWNGAPVIRDTFSTIFVSSLTALTASDSIYVNSNLIAPSAFISTLSTNTIYLAPVEPSNVSSALYTNSTQVLYWNGKPLIDPSTLFISSLIAPDILSPSGVVNISGKLTATNAEISSLKTDIIYIKTGKLTTDTNLDLFWNNKSLTETTSTFSTIYASSISALNSSDTIYFTSPIFVNNAEITNIATKGIVLGASDGIVSSLLYTDSSLTLYWNSTIISGPATQKERFSTIYVSSISALSPSDTIYFNNTFYASDAKIGQVFTNAIVLNNSTNTASSVLYADANLVLYWNNKPLIGGSQPSTLTSSFSTIFVSSIGSLSPSDTIYFTNPIYASDATVLNLFTNNVTIRNSTNTVSSVLYTDDNLVLYWNNKPLNGGGAQPTSTTITSSFSTLYVSTIGALGSSDIIYFANSFYASDATVKKLFTSGIVLSEQSGLASSLLYTDSSLVLYWNNAPLGAQATSSFKTLFASSIGSLTPGTSVSFISPISSVEANISTVFTNALGITGIGTSTNGFLYTDSTLKLYWNGKPVSANLQDPLKVSSLIVSSISAFDSTYTIYFNNNFAGSTAQISTMSVNGLELTSRNSTQQGLIYADDFMTLFWNGKPLVGSSFNTLYASDAIIDILFASDAIIGSLKASDAVINKITASDGSFHNIITNYIGSEQKLYFTSEFEAPKAFISDLTAGILTLEDQLSKKRGILNTDETLNLYWNSTLITTSTYIGFNISGLKVSSISGLTPTEIIHFNNPIEAQVAEFSSLKTAGVSFQYQGKLGAISSAGVSSSAIGLLYADANENLLWNGKRLNIDPSTLTEAALFVSSISGIGPSSVVNFVTPLAAQTIILKSGDKEGFLRTDSSLNLYWNSTLISGSQSTPSASSLSFSTISSLFVSSISALNPGDIIYFNSPFSVSTAQLNSLQLKGANTISTAILYANSSLELYWNNKKILIDPSTLRLSSLYVSSISAQNPSDIIYFNNPISVSTAQATGILLTGQTTSTAGLLYANSSLQLFWNGYPIASQMSSLSSMVVDNFTATNANISSLTANGIFFTGRDSSSISLLYADNHLDLFWNGSPISKLISSFERFTISSLEVSSVNANNIKASDAFIGHLVASDASISKIIASDGFFNNIVTNYIGGNDTLYFTSPFAADKGVVSTVDANGLYLTGRSSFAKGLLHTDSSLVLYWNGSSIAGLQAGTGGSTFSTLYASTAYITNLLATDAQIKKLTASDGTIFKLYSSDANIGFISAGKAVIFTTLTNSLGAIPITQTASLAVTAPVIQFTSPFNAGQGKIALFSASDAFINTLYASDAFINHITASDATINNIVANYIGGQQDKIYFTSPFYADIGNTSTIDANGLYLTGRSSFVKGLLHTDSSLVLYWNGSSIAGQQPGSGGVGGSTFSTLYAMRAYINYLYASDAYLQKLWASDAIIGQASISTGSISTLRASLMEADEGLITHVATNIISLPSTTYKLGAVAPKAIQFTSPFQATSASFVKLFASDAKIDRLQASDAFITHLTGSDATVNSIVVNYIGAQQDIVYFTSPFQTDIGNASTLNANGLYLTGRSSFVKGLLHTDSSLVLYWNGSSIAGQQPGSGGIGGSTFSTLYAMRAYINYLYASDSYLQKLWASDAIIGKASVSTALISTVQASKVTAELGEITTVTTSFIGAPKPMLTSGSKAAANQIQFTSPFKATYASFVQLFASDAKIDRLQASDAFITHITASDAKINSIVANYIGGQQDTIYFTSPFQTDIGNASTLNADGLYLTGASSFKKGLLYTDSSLVLYWNGSSIAGQIPGTSGGGGGSTFSTLYAMRAYINYLYATDAYLQKLWASDAKIGNASVSTAEISTLQASEATITKIATSFIGVPKTQLGFRAAKEIQFTSPFQAVEGRFVKLYASDAHINLLQASDAFINHITASDAKVNNVTANYIGSQQDKIYFTSPFQADNGQISSVNANGLYLTGASSFVKGLLYTDSSLVLYWNGSSIAGQIPGTSGGGGGSTFSTLYAMKAYINYLYASDSYLSKLWASDAIIGNASVSTAKLSTVQASNIAAVKGSITTLEASFIGAPKTQLTYGSAKQIQFTSPFQAVEGRFIKLYASDANIYRLQASDAIINKITASDAIINNVVANYIGGAQDNLYFTSPFQGPKGSVSTVAANGIYLTGVSSLNTGLLYTDSNLTLYWNGSSIAGQVPGSGIGGSTFSTLFAYKAYINYLYATDAFISSGQISTIKSDEAAITRVVTSFIGAPKTQALQAKASNQIQFTSPFLAVAGRFVKLYASDGEINVLKSSDAFIDRLTASDAKINNIVANYIGASQDNIYFTSPFQAQIGLISTVDADGLYLTGISSFKRGLLHTDSTLTLYWNGSSIAGPQANITNGGGSTFSTLYAMRAYINYLYASDSYLQKLWASDAIIGAASVSTADISTLQADKGLITTVQTNFIGSINPTAGLYKGKNKIQFTSPFQAIAGSFVKLYASDGSINLLKASDAFINHLTASDANINNVIANYIGGSQDNIYFTSPFVAEKGRISTLRAHKAFMDYIYVKDAHISTQTGSFANISSISTVNLMAFVGDILTIGTNVIGLPETLYQTQTQYTMNHSSIYESTFIPSYTPENEIRFVSPFQGLTGRLNKLIASDAIVNNVLANYIGGPEDNIYFTSPFTGPEGNINNLLAGSALIDSLRAGNASISTLTAGYASISTLKASDASIYLLRASDATVKNLKAKKAQIDKLVVTDSKIDNLLVNKIKILDNLSVDSFHTIDSFNSKLVASDTVINNITANYIGSHDDLLYITSPFKGSQAYIDKVIASDADIKWLRINKIGVIQPYQSIEFVSKFEATVAKINTLEVSTLIFTDNTQQLQTNILVATGPSSKLGNRLLYKIDNNNWMGSKINSNDKQLIIKTVKWNGNRFLAAGLSRNKGILLQSKDGITWDVCNTVLDFLEINSINWYNEMWLIAGTPKSGTASTLLASQDGINWSIPSGFSDRNTIYSKLVHNGKRILALGTKSGSNLAVIINSKDGINWFNSETASFSIVANSAAWGGATWIAVGESETDPTIKSIMRSKNGSRWTTSITGSALKVGKDILWSSKNKCWLACGIADDIYANDLQKYANNTILKSSDGFTWNQVNNPALTATNTLLWQEPYFIASGDTKYKNIRISQANTSLIKSKDGLNWTPYVNHHKGFTSPQFGCLEKASYDNRNRTKMMNPQNIRTLTFELSSPEIQYYEITHNDKLIMVKFHKSTPAIFAEPENLQIHIYGAYFKEGHTIKIQCCPYEVGEMSLEEYTDAKYTLYSPNNELSMETTNPYTDTAILSQRNILHITFYNGHWIKTYSI